MNVKNYMMLVLAEECGEVVLDYLNDKSFVYESIDVISIYEILNVKFPEFENLDKSEILNDKEFISVVNILQHTAIKCLRFGFKSINPVTKKENLKIVVECGERITNYILMNYTSNLNDYEYKKSAKAKKVWKYYNKHRREILEKYGETR